MPLDRKSAHQLAFGHYLRTGERLTVEEWSLRGERKFNPYHDELGRFTSSPGVTVSYGNQAVRMAERAVGGTRRTVPAPVKTIPPGGQIIAEAGFRAARSTNEALTRAQGRAAPIRPPVKALLTQITNGEGVGDDEARNHGFASSYDVPFNYGRYARQSKPLTQMTLREVDDLQTRTLNNPENRLKASPVGKYQIVRTTLRDLKNKLNLSDDMIFDENLQDRLGMARLEQAGLNDFVDGRISEQDFQLKIAGAWASVADPRTGRPKLSNQHLGTTTAQISPLIRALRQK